MGLLRIENLTTQKWQWIEVIMTQNVLDKAMGMGDAKEAVHDGRTCS